jgi:hypothetical protein
MKNQFVNAFLVLAKAEDDESNEHCFHIANEVVYNAITTMLNFLDIKFDEGYDALTKDWFITFENIEPSEFE